METAREKQESGMRKLIDLLYEYMPNMKREKIHKGAKMSISDLFICSNTAIIISKFFGFVSWLVENEKVKPLRKFIGWETDEDEPYIQFDLVDQYIAYLSIQDEPINFLISILK